MTKKKRRLGRKFSLSGLFLVEGRQEKTTLVNLKERRLYIKRVGILFLLAVGRNRDLLSLSGKKLCSHPSNI